jgi:hypothetical protein
MNQPSLSHPVLRGASRVPARSGIVPQSIACVTGTVENGAICVDLPIIGKKCINVGLNIANGLSASVCLESIFPPKVCANVLGQQFCL